MRSSKGNFQKQKFLSPSVKYICIGGMKEWQHLNFLWCLCGVSLNLYHWRNKLQEFSTVTFFFPSSHFAANGSGWDFCFVSFQLLLFLFFQLRVNPYDLYYLYSMKKVGSFSALLIQNKLEKKPLIFLAKPKACIQFLLSPNKPYSHV